jgi:hypothetical protein
VLSRARARRRALPGRASSWCWLAAQEGQQVRVERVLVRRGIGQAVRGTRVDHQGGVLDDLGGQPSGIIQRDDLVVITLDNQDRARRSS